MNKRQEKRAQGDLRHRDRDRRLRQLLAAKSRKTKSTKYSEEDAQDPAAESRLDGWVPPLFGAASGAPCAFETNGLVIGIAPGLCTVVSGEEKRLVRCDLPVAPGDEVSIRNEKVMSIAQRRTTLARTDPANPHRDHLIAANIDLLVIVASIDDPPFRPALVDRYLIAAWRGGVPPILCINKTDLSAEPLAGEIFHIPVVRCSAVTGEGVPELGGLLAGSLALLAGQSGVGKSSLLNALAGTSQARTGDVNKKTGKGRHTTTSSKLYRLPNGARIIDTPGIREFGLGPVTPAELRAAFPEFQAVGCRFSDCSHREEPDCVVRSRFIANGATARYASYLRLAAETGSVKI